MMKHWMLLAASAVALSACRASLGETSPENVSAVKAVASFSEAEKIDRPVTAKVSREADRWQVDYQLNRDSRAWFFSVSQPLQADRQLWRQQDWRVITPGVRIERHGNYDVLVSTSGGLVPQDISITFTPTNATLDREYDPSVTFGVGTTALYSDQFDVIAANTPDEVDDIEAGRSVEDLGGIHAHVTFHDAAGPVFVQGKRQRDPVLAGAETYVVFGTGKIEVRGGVAMLAHPDLPEWLKVDVAGFAPQVEQAYAVQLGARADRDLPLLLMGWRGATAGKVINDGGVRPGQILFNFEGEGLLERNQRASRRTRWFIAHELAHFWLGTSGVAYREPSDAWITEGGAEMMAFTLLAQTDHEYALNELQRAVESCIVAADKPVGEAAERHESRAFSACGATFALAATSAGKRNGGASFADFIRPLLAAHRTERLLGSDDWLTHLTAVAGDEQATAIIRAMVRDGVADPKTAVATLFQLTGVPYSRNDEALILGKKAI